MRHLVVYRRPRTEFMDDTRRRNSYDQYDSHYYDEDDYYDRPNRMHRDAEEYPYYDDDDYEYYYRMNSGHYRSERARNKSFVLPNEKVANLIMNASSFGEYIQRHGYHFTPELADCATKMLKNADRREHRWTSDQIRQQLTMHGLNDWGRCTLGDLTFLANMAYADFYPEVLPSEHACIKYAIAVAKDPDGYDGVAFSRWIADLIGNKVTTIDWELYV